MTKIYAPIFERDGNDLIAPNYGWASHDEDEARDIGRGVALVEAVVMGIRWSTRILEAEVDANGQAHDLPHVPVGIGPCEMLCIKGPLLDKAIDEECGESA